MIAEKNEVAATAQTDAARARNALQMAASRQATFRASRAATVRRLASVAENDAILADDDDDDDEVPSNAERRA